MEQPNQSAGHLPVMAAAFLALVLALVGVFLGQRAWSHQTTLTKNFEACMEAAPFKHALNTAKTEASVTPEELPKHF